MIHLNPAAGVCLSQRFARDPLPLLRGLPQPRRRYRPPRERVFVGFFHSHAIRQDEIDCRRVSMDLPGYKFQILSAYLGTWNLRDMEMKRCVRI